MRYLVKNKKLRLNYAPGKGAWTYHVRVPNTRDLKGKWGDLKVSGTIDGFNLVARNLAPTKGQDKMLSINSSIRKAINKTGGQFVNMTLHLLKETEPLARHHILSFFDEAGVLLTFSQRTESEQLEILETILRPATEEMQVKKIDSYISILKRQG